jgi:hypothetical protein
MAAFARRFDDATLPTIWTAGPGRDPLQQHPSVRRGRQTWRHLGRSASTEPMIVVVAEFRRRARELAPKVRAMKLRRVAYHEAAHAIVAAHFGLVVDQVGVEVAARLEAGVVVAVRGRPLDRATVLAAGGEAERWLTGQEPRGTEG